MNNRYMMRGVSAAKEDVHNAIKNIDKGVFPQAFCKIIPDILGGDDAYCNIMHADGAGTKSSLAYVRRRDCASRRHRARNRFFSDILPCQIEKI